MDIGQSAIPQIAPLLLHTYPATMSRGGMKKRAAENQQKLTLHTQLIVAINAVYLLWKVWWRAEYWTGWNWMGLILLWVVYYIFYYTMLYCPGKPTIDPNTREVLHDGMDLKQGGLTEYYWDIVYIAMFVQFTTIFSDWFWLVFLSIPGYALYMLMSKVVLPWVFSNDEEPVELSDKQQRRKDRKEKGKVKYMRG